MRNKRLLVALLVMVLLALWWLLSRSPKVPPATVTTKPLPQAASTNASPRSGESTPALPPSPPPPPPQPSSLRARFEQMLSDYRTPINFFGKVVDQHGEPVADAQVTFHANDKPSGENTSSYERKTDAAGTFSLEGAAGITLGVGVSKPGYRGIPPVYGKTTSSGFYEYGLSSQDSYRSSKEAPTVFTLYKVGAVEPLVKVGEKNFRMARDGSPLTIPLDNQGGHQVVLRCWNKDREPRPPGEQKYDWRWEIAVPDGGIMTRTDAFAFEAPESGYLPSDTIEMLASMPYSQWDDSAQRSYFFRFGDGTSACANLRMRAGGDHFVVWESFFNPKVGSRNLESDPAKAAP